MDRRAGKRTLIGSEAMELFCQWLIVVIVLLSSLYSIHREYTPKPVREPCGAHGMFLVVAVTAVEFAVLYGAGAMSRILGSE